MHKNQCRFNHHGNTHCTFHNVALINTCNGITQKINIAEGTIKNIESGAVASFQVYYDIAQALQVSLDSLTPDFMSSTSASGIKSTDMQLFIEIYKNTSSNEREILMKVIKSFHVSCPDGD